jgi:carbamoyltransferase
MQNGDRYILGIHDGHNCGATLTRNGVILASVSEERLVRQKNAVGYPTRSIEEVLRIGSVSEKELSAVVYASLFMHDASKLEDVSDQF